MLLLLGLAALAAVPEPTPLTETHACRVVGDMVGPEDFAVLDGGEAARVLVSASRYRPGDQGPSDGFFALELSSGEQARMEIAGRDACGLHPHGVALSGPPEARELWAVVHFRAEDAENPGCALARDERGRPVLDAVERYRVGDRTLTLLERLQDPLMTEPNDLVVSEDGRIFVSSNPAFTPLGLARGALLGWRPSELLGFAPGQGWRVLADRFFYANGVLLDEGGDLWVSSYGGRLTRLAEGADGWERVGGSRLRGALDNMMIGEDGRLWIAGHPSPLGFARHAEDPAEIGPSVAWSLRREGEGYVPEAGLIDRTGAVNASSTVTRIGGELVFAQVFQPGLVICAPR